MPLKRLCIVFSVLCMFLLGGCLKRTSSQIKHNTESSCESDHRALQYARYEDFSRDSWVKRNSYNSIDSLRQQEARLIDIPVPVHADPLNFNGNQLNGEEKDSLVLAYRVYSTKQDVRSFFVLEMERLGWNMIADIEGLESLLVFIKPTKVCTVSMRTNYEQEASSLIVITYGNNTAGYWQE